MEVRKAEIGQNFDFRDRMTGDWRQGRIVIAAEQNNGRLSTWQLLVRVSDRNAILTSRAPSCIRKMYDAPWTSSNNKKESSP